MAELISMNWLLFLLIAFCILYVAFQLSKDAPVARKIFSRFLFNIVLPLGVIMGIPLLLLALYTNLDERVWQAIIAGVVIATGWLTTAIFNELGKAQERAEKLRDYHKAIFAEIRNSLAAMYYEGEAETHAAEIVERMQDDPNFVPLIPREHHDFIYNAILENIEVLPRATIDAIVAYYSLIKSVSAQADDMRGEGFQKLEQTRRILMYQDYFETRKRAFAIGQYALKLITEFSKNGAKSTDRLAEKLNTPAEAQNDPSPGSE